MKVEHFTGKLHSREDYAELLRSLTRPTRPFFSPDGARFRNLTAAATYPTVAQENEGCMRILWGLFPLWAGDKKETFFRDVYRNTFRAGTDPENPEYWGEGMEDRDQRFVEYATLGCGLLICPEAILGGMSEEEKTHFAAYMNLINEYPVCGNNWIFFRILANCGLKKNGLPYQAEQIERDFETIEGFYLGDGWYSDGRGSTQRDYYVAFAIHFYSLIYAATMGDEDPARAALFRERATLFAQDFIYWFDKSGASVAYGRSQTYRFAQAAFFSALVFSDTEALPWGVVKGILNRNLRYFLSMPILDNAGLLSIGYGYPNLVMSEQYNGSGAPYWAFKSFLCLARGADHPFFAAEEAPYPDLPPLRAMPHAGFIAQKTSTDTVLLGGGQCGGGWLTHAPEKYEKFAYSAAFGFSVPRNDYAVELMAPDSMLTFFYMDTCFVRRRHLSFAIEGNTSVSRWSPFPGVTVTTTLTPMGEGHLRRHVIESSVSCRAYDAGFSLPRAEDPEEEQIQKTARRVEVTTPLGRETVEARGEGGEPTCVYPMPNTNLVYSRTLLPCMIYEITPGTQVLETYVEAQRILPETKAE